MDELLPVKSKLDLLVKSGAEMDISCFWQSKNGQGGPTFSPEQLIKLGNLEIEMWIDIY